MDTRRLSSGDVLAYGILSKPVPLTDEPEDREKVGLSIEDVTAERVTAELSTGKVVSCSEYYGIPITWELDGQYRAILLQYRSGSENHTFATVVEAAEWFVDTAHAVAG